MRGTSGANSGRTPLRGPENRSQPIKHAKACPNTLPMPICPACVCLPSLFRPPHGVGVRKEGADHDGRCPRPPTADADQRWLSGRSGSSAATRPHARLVERAHADSRAPQLVQADTAIAVHQRAPESIGHVLACVAVRALLTTTQALLLTADHRVHVAVRARAGAGGTGEIAASDAPTTARVAIAVRIYSVSTFTPRVSLARSACPDPWTHARGSHPSCWSPAMSRALPMRAISSSSLKIQLFATAADGFDHGSYSIPASSSSYSESTMAC